jgi:hypothetical protein
MAVIAEHNTLEAAEPLHAGYSLGELFFSPRIPPQAQLA